MCPRTDVSESRSVSGFVATCLGLFFLVGMLVAPSLAAGGLPSPVPLSPLGTTTGATPEYSWEPVSGATWYQLWVNDTTGTVLTRWYTSSEVGAGSGTCRATPPEALASGGATWWVRGWNAESGGGPWSVAADFTVGVGCQAEFQTAWTQSPADGGVFVVPVTSDPTCSWSIDGAANLPEWISIQAGSGLGDGEIVIDLAPNLGEFSVARQAILRLGDREHLVSQVGPGAFLGWHFESSTVEVSGDGYRVVDVFAAFDDPASTVLNVFASLIDTSTGVEFHHNDANTLSGSAGAWNVGGTVDLPALGVVPDNDSFVLIGGPVPGVGNTTSLDPSFDPGTGGTIAPDAGWFNSNPPNAQGLVDPVTGRTWVARLIVPASGAAELRWSANLSYNRGPGSGAEFGFTPTVDQSPTFVVPFPE